MNVHRQNGLQLGEQFRPAAVPVDWLDVLPAETDCLRSYQRQQIAEVARALHRGVKRLLVQLPTGGGKTHEISAIVLAASVAGLRVLILVTRTRLVRQIHERLTDFGVRHGVIAAPLPELRNFNASVQIASIDTLHRRAIVDRCTPLPSADVVIFDEAHLSTAKTRLGVLNSYPAAIRVGFTATPARKSGTSLGAAFDYLIMGPSIRELTEAGTLVPTRIFNTPIVTQKELSAIPKDIDKDFSASALGAVLSRPKLVGDVVANWLRIANRKRTLCFAVNKSHAAALLDSFRMQGIAAEMLTDTDDEPTREEVLERLETGATSVVVNCFLMSYGIDLPSVECIILARPTRSLPMYLQMVGRGLRASPGKTCCLVIDHGHVVENLGLPQTEFEWSLDPAKNVNTEAARTSKRKVATEALRTCRECAGIWLTSEQGHSCPLCGWTPLPRSKPVAFEDAELAEIADDPERITPNDARVIWFYRESVGWYARRWPDRWRMKPKSGRWWAWVQTMEKFQIAETVRIPQSYWESSPVAPSPEVSGWLQHRIIKWAKARANASAA